MKLVDSVFVVLSLSFLVIGIHQAITIGLAESYWIFMFSLMNLFLYGYRKNKRKQKESSNKMKASKTGKPTKRKHGWPISLFDHSSLPAFFSTLLRHGNRLCLSGQITHWSTKKKRETLRQDSRTFFKQSISISRYNAGGQQYRLSAVRNFHGAAARTRCV